MVKLFVGLLALLAFLAYMLAAICAGYREQYDAGTFHAVMAILFYIAGTTEAE